MKFEPSDVTYGTAATSEGSNMPQRLVAINDFIANGDPVRMKKTNVLVGTVQGMKKRTGDSGTSQETIAVSQGWWQ
jgi:hypothetical protein